MFSKSFFNCFYFFYIKSYISAHIVYCKSIICYISNYFLWHLAEKGFDGSRRNLFNNGFLVGGGFWGGNGFGDWRGFDGKACGSYFQLSKRNSFSRGLLKQYF